MSKKKLINSLEDANRQKCRLAAPLLGFPGLKLAKSTVKLAQQNYAEHFKVLKAIADTFHPDLIFPLMDLSVEANALGRYTLFPVQEPATVVRQEFTEENLKAIENIDIKCDTRLYGYVETVSLMKSLPENILRGAYVTGPYTLTGLLIGSDNAALASITDTDYLHKICEIVTSKISDYINLLIEAGADIICILEPGAVMLGPEQFIEFSGNYVRILCEKFRAKGTSFIYHICGNTNCIIEQMASSGVDALSLDSPDTGVDLYEAAGKIKYDIIIIGNISPVQVMLFGTPELVRDEVTKLLNRMSSFPNFILSTGCDLPQEVPLENISAFMDAARSYTLSK